jgi:hypothetical protein
MSQERQFGPYLLEVDGDHAVIRRADDQPVEPGWYELQHMKCLAFGAQATAVEVFPASHDLVDGQHQRHLSRVERSTVPNLRG